MAMLGFLVFFVEKTTSGFGNGFKVYPMVKRGDAEKSHEFLGPLLKVASDFFSVREMGAPQNFRENPMLVKYWFICPDQWKVKFMYSCIPLEN